MLGSEESIPTFKIPEGLDFVKPGFECINDNVNLGIAGDAPTDPVKLYQRLLAEAVEAKNRETLEACYREDVGSPTGGGPGAALMSEQYALEEGEREKGDREQFEEYRSVPGKNAPESFAEFLDLKYNSGEWEAFKSYKRAIQTGELSALADFSLYQETSREIDKNWWRLRRQTE